MTAREDDEIDDLLTDDLAKGRAKPLTRTPKQIARAAAAAARREEEQALATAKAAEAAAAQRLAQIVNLHIAGHSLADIGASIGATAEEVDRMLAQDAQRYIRTQPQLRTYVRNYISGKYTELLDAVWDEATNKLHPAKLEHQDRALRILREMDRLHGAAAPTQTEVKVDAAPESVQRMVDALASASGLGYDASIFDTVPGEVVHSAPAQALAALEKSARVIEEGDDPL